jgi:ubiquinone/menaquinone biosynthesis C-methylase UbiE
MKRVLKQFIPPVVISVFRQIGGKSTTRKIGRPDSAKGQELDIYWTEDMAYQLENWGKAHTWNEIECLLVNCEGKVLDIACGTGVNILSMAKFKKIQIFGFDISDFLIKKAIEKGIDKNRLSVQDATQTAYQDNEFAYSYSIGSLEHFTEEGIDSFLKECSRYTSKASFHMIPVSESDKDEGWMRTNQSFHNNSVGWWLAKYRKHFAEVLVINSGYTDPGLSLGKWFICLK